METKSGSAFAAAIVLTLLSACATRERPAAASPADFIVRTINDGTAVKITGFNGGTTDVRIPPRLEGLPVTAIGPSAFARRQLTSVRLPDTVTHIGVTAFWNNHLGEVRIPPVWSTSAVPPSRGTISIGLGFHRARTSAHRRLTRGSW